MMHIESAEPLSPQQQEVWNRVEELWRLLQRRDIAAISAAIHPQYTGWEAAACCPTDRDFALKAAETDPGITGFRLYPMQVEVYDGIVGVALYTFEADVAKGKPRGSGQWTEVYLKKDGIWLMISVSGGSMQRRHEQHLPVSEARLRHSRENGSSPCRVDSTGLTCSWHFCEDTHMPVEHHETFPVRYWECNALGHLSSTNYFRWMQEAAFGASAAVGYDWARYREMGYVWLVRETDIRYLRPAAVRRQSGPEDVGAGLPPLSFAAGVRVHLRGHGTAGGHGGYRLGLRRCPDRPAGDGAGPDAGRHSALTAPPGGAAAGAFPGIPRRAGGCLLHRQAGGVARYRHDVARQQRRLPGLR